MEDQHSTPEDHVERTIATYDAIAAHYHLANTPQRLAAKQEALDAFIDQLPSSDELRVLVPGCGLGEDARYLRSKGITVDAFDLSSGMLIQARKADPEGSYAQLDLRDIGRLEHCYHGVWARGCLYHLSPVELEKWYSDCATILEPAGVLYFSMKEGHGQEMRVVPAPGYSGGSKARTKLRGERYYSYYTVSEIEGMVSKWFKSLHQRSIHGMQPAFEFWLRKRDLH